MALFTEFIEQTDNLTTEEMEEAKRIITRKLIERRRDEILLASEEARRESAEGKTIVLSTPEEIKSYFEKILNEAD